MAQVLLELYGEGLARMMEVIAEGEHSERTVGALAEGVTEPPPKPTTTFVATPTVRKKEKKRPEEDQTSWTVVGGLPQLSGSELLVKEVSGEPVLFMKLGNEFYAYRHLCPCCGGSL